MRSSLQCEPVCAGREGTVRSAPGDGIQQDEEGAGCMGRGEGKEEGEDERQHQTSELQRAGSEVFTPRQSLDKSA